MLKCKYTASDTEKFYLQKNLAVFEYVGTKKTKDCTEESYYRWYVTHTNNYRCLLILQ